MAAGAGRKSKRRAMPKLKKTDWRFLTQPVMEALGVFQVDPYSHPSPVVVAAPRMIQRGGLRADWGGQVWLNLPTNEPVAPWLVKLEQHGTGVALLKVRSASEEWHKLVYGSRRCTGIFMFRGKPVMVRETGHQEVSPHELALVCFGNAALARVTFAQSQGVIQGTLIGRIGDQN